METCKVSPDHMRRVTAVIANICNYKGRVVIWLPPGGALSSNLESLPPDNIGAGVTQTLGLLICGAVATLASGSRVGDAAG